MAFIVVTDATTQPIVVKNGDRVVLEVSEGTDVRIVSDPNANVKNFEIIYGDDTVANMVTVDLSSFSSYGLKINVRDYDPTDTIVLEDSFATSIDPGNEDECQFQYIGDNGIQYDGFVRTKDVGERDLTDKPQPIIICFTDGTIIHTETGPLPVEALRVGDMVETEDNGLQPIRWIGKRQLDTIDLAMAPNLLPVRISAGSLGDNLPYSDLTVSPQHRIKLSDWRSELLFGEAEVLTPAKSFVDGEKVQILDVPTVTYYHLLFDHHEIICSNGLMTESLHPGDMALRAVGDETLEEFKNIFGDIPDDVQMPLEVRKTARPVLKIYEARAARTYAA